MLDHHRERNRLSFTTPPKPAGVTSGDKIVTVTCRPTDTAVVHALSRRGRTNPLKPRWFLTFELTFSMRRDGIRYSELLMLVPPPDAAVPRRGNQSAPFKPQWHIHQIRWEIGGNIVRSEGTNCGERKIRSELPGNGMVGVRLIGAKVTGADRGGQMTPQPGMLVAN